MRTTTVSVILPCYNHERYLRERIASILPQLLPADQIVFLDDASTDGSVKLARDLLANAVCPVSIHLNEANTGSPFLQWQKGLRHATKEWIWIAETDDRCETDMLERLLARAEEEDSALVFCQSIYMNADGIRIGHAWDHTVDLYGDTFTRDFTMPAEDFLHRHMLVRNAILNTSSALFRRSLLERGVSLANGMRSCGDYLFWLNMLGEGNVSFVSEAMNHFRITDQSTRQRSHATVYKAEVFACHAYAASRYCRKQTHDALNASDVSGYLELNPAFVLETHAVSARRYLKSFFPFMIAVHRLSGIPRLTIGAWMHVFAAGWNRTHRRRRRQRRQRRKT